MAKRKQKKLASGTDEESAGKGVWAEAGRVSRKTLVQLYAFGQRLSNLRESFCLLTAGACDRGKTAAGSCTSLCKAMAGRLKLCSGRFAKRTRPAEPEDVKGQFLNAITNELHTPISTIESYLGRIEKNLEGDGPLSPALMHDYLARVKFSVKHLSNFIDDLVGVSDIEREGIECEMKPMRIQDAVEEVIGLFEAKGEEEEITLSSRIDPSLDEVIGDFTRLRQVLTRLIDNAFKFTQSGGEIWIQAKPSRVKGKDLLTVAVCDTGCGMDEEDQKKLFKKFQQGKNISSLAGEKRGSGLGLFIVKAIIEAHGSSVSVKSKRGKGTEIAFPLKIQ